MLKSLHDDLVLWGKSQGEDSDDGDVQDKLTVPHEVSAELKRVVEVSLVLVVELALTNSCPSCQASSCGTSVQADGCDATDEF